MTENYLFGNPERKKSSNGWLVIVLLILSFVWTSLFTTASSLTNLLYWNFGDLLDFNSVNFGSVLTMVFAEAISYWIVFEIVFYLYRYVLQFKIYSFIIPKERLKIESRTYFIYRNVFYGLFLNLCFLFPYLYIFAPVVSLIATFATLILYSVHLNKTYAEPIIGHFVFKNFCFPIFVYQAIVLFIDIIEVL